MATDHPVTMAVRFLRERGASFEPHVFVWEKKGAKASAEVLGVDPAIVIKTLVFEDDGGRPLLALMDGAHEVSTKALARLLGAKVVRPCAPARAEALTGYQVGGISPFGTKVAMPVYMQEDLILLDRAFINGGKRGFLIALEPDAIRALLDATLVDVAV